MSWIPPFEIGMWNAWILMLFYVLHPFILMVLFILIAYSVFLPLKLATVWFYAGLAMYLVGLGMLLATIVNIATTPMGQVFKQGLYRFSRHPGYVSMAITLLGVSVASASLIFFLFASIYIILMMYQVDAEEQGCLQTFGDEYEEYMVGTPRWIGKPRSR